MKHSTAILLLALAIVCCQVHAGSCTNCTYYYECSSGAEFCCNNKCAIYPALGESCLCQQCAPGLACINGVCTSNGLNCSCTSTSECTSGGYQDLVPTCVNNTCKLVSSNPPINYFTPGGPCGSQCLTQYCNPSTNLCDYNPLGTSCQSTYFCEPANVCIGTCQPRKLAGEECTDDQQCPSNYVCRQTSSSSPTVCAQKAEAGEYCSDQNSCNLMNCASNVCTYPARGDPCFGGRCGPNDVCYYRNATCIAKNSLPEGELCGSVNDCQTAICSGRCLSMSTLGGVCNVTEQCPNSRCLDNKCTGIAFSGEKCNSTYTCFNLDRPCQTGVCPQYYSAIGGACTSDYHCAVGRCSNSVCDAPTTCQTQADCGRNMICECGQCVPLNTDFAGYTIGGLYQSEANQLTSRSPERDCVYNMVVNSQCESIIARYYCYSNCYGSFPNAQRVPHKIDCATLKVLALNVTKQPCCSATALTDCADTLLNCNIFNENNVKPFITRPSTPTAPVTSAPSSAPTAPSATPTTPVGTPTAPSVPSGNTPQATPSASVPQATPMSTPQSTAVPSSAPTAPVTTPSSSSTCNCAAPAPLCDQELSACVGLRVTPVVQCVEYANNQYTAYMTYINAESSDVTLSDKINFLNVNVQDKVSQFAPGRPFTYPQSAFNVIAASAQQVSWYLDGFKLTFDIAAEELRCPQDVTFQMTSSATVAQLLAISDSLIGNLSDVMQIERSRLTVTFSASAKRQTTSSVITVVVRADQNSTDSSSHVVLDFVQTGFSTFVARVPTAAVASVSTVPPANEQSGFKTVTPPTNPIALNTPRDRSVVSSGVRVLTNIALLILVSFVVITQ